MSTLPALNSGDLRHRIEIWRKTPVDDKLGGRKTEWARISRPWAQVLGQAGREAVIGQALQGISVYRLRVRFAADVIDKDQIRHGKIVLNVKSVTDPNGDREQKVIIADTESIEALPDG